MKRGKGVAAAALLVAVTFAVLAPQDVLRAVNAGPADRREVPISAVLPADLWLEVVSLSTEPDEEAVAAAPSGLPPAFRSLAKRLAPRGPALPKRVLPYRSQGPPLFTA